jgi:hypothetical protein
VAALATVVDVDLRVNADVVTTALPRSLVAATTAVAAAFRSFGTAGGEYAFRLRIGDGVDDEAELAWVVPITLATDELAVGNLVRLTQPAGVA